MNDKFLMDYINDMYNKQNIGSSLEQKGLYTKKDYYELLKPVIELTNAFKDYSMEELRRKLYENSGIEEKVRELVYKKEMVPGMVFSYGTKNFQETVVIGSKQEVKLDENGKLIPAVEQMTEDTIFDLASVTKLYTSLSILKLVEMGKINFDDKITKYVPEFKNLNEVNIFDLLSFSVPLKTDERVDKAPSKEEGERILFNIYPDRESKPKNSYTDMGAMVLKYVIEKVTQMNYYDFVDKYILKELGLVDTHVQVPEYKLDRVASTNFDGKYFKDGNYILNTTASIGKVYDPKAQVMSQENGNLSGHAGLFSTAKDMTTLAKGMIGGQIIDQKYIELMAQNRTGKLLETNEFGNSKFTQYLGFLCYSKHPIQSDSELFHAMSGKALASAGWTGTQLTVDPINELYFFLGSNRSHNRMTFIDPTHNDKVETNEFGKKTILLPNGEVRIDSRRYAWDRDDYVVHSALKLAIQYKMLEDIMHYDKDFDNQDENIVQL